MSRRRSSLATLALACALACGESERAPAPTPSAPGAPPPAEQADEHGFGAPSRYTVAANQKVAAGLALADPVDFEEAKRGFVATDENISIVTATGRTWSPEEFAFVEGDAPPSVNPSLWRQAKLNANHGLFEVTEGVYQVRGYDVSNMTWIRGRTGWIVVDPLTSVESAAAARALARKHLGDDPIVAVIFTHSHVDHFGGVAGLWADGAAEKVQVIAPKRFVEEVASENVYAGTAMARRATYQFGFSLPDGPRGYVDTGLGKQPLAGTTSFAIPTDEVSQTPQEMDIDGVRFVFQYAPDSEAPAELAFYLPDKKVYLGAELVNRTMHNLYTLRGTKVRDALKWSSYIDDAIQRFPDVEIVATSHTWPVFGNARAIAYLKGQRDTYRYIHDQTLRLANQGATPREIAEEIELPPSLAAQFANRGYYGTTRHNAKAVYQFYFGWYDGNPANLDPLPPEPLGKKYVEAIGGAAAVKEKARAAIGAGDYRWAATLLDHLVFADANDEEARDLLASAYEQLGYQAESGVWRAVYLSGANELRQGVVKQNISVRSAAAILEQVPLDLFFAAMATRIDGPEAATREPTTLNFVFTDVGETHVLQLENGVLHHWKRDADPNAAVTVELTRGLFLKMVAGDAGLKDLIFSDELHVQGSRATLLSFFGLLDPVDPNFAIVTP
ncbi:MAG TPA: alkyl sulfatase dimerization domain-containing protein [Myxococcota bacterium]|nr:alkyl sulfatase dimerization domain-containing protein [Myxococcota bacterium]